MFGCDEAGKPHASAFSQSEVELATKAAELMGMRLLPVRTDADLAIAAKVPRGRVFASGRAFVPFIKASLFADLQAASLSGGGKPLEVVAGPATGGTGAPTQAAPAKPPKGKSKARVKQPCGWADIQTGAIVLSANPPKYQQWYECVVVAVEGQEQFTLRFCDWPNEPAFVRRRVPVGLMHPAHQPEPPLEPEPAAKAA